MCFLDIARKSKLSNSASVHLVLISTKIPLDHNRNKDWSRQDIDRSKIGICANQSYWLVYGNFVATVLDNVLAVPISLPTFQQADALQATINDFGHQLQVWAGGIKLFSQCDQI